MPIKYIAVVSGGAEGALAPPEFRRSVDPIPTRGVRLCPPRESSKNILVHQITASTNGFENLTTSLKYKHKYISIEYLLVYQSLYLKLKNI